MTDFLKRYRMTALFGMVFAAILYSMMMSQQLTNTFDGLWHQNYLYAGLPELTSGRWMLHYIDHLNMGLHADPIASLITLSLFVLGFLLILDLFGVKSKTTGFLGMALFLSSTVVCNTLSYRMTSMGYGFAFLFAVLGIYAAVKVKNRAAAAIVSGVSLGLSMACYQAYLGVFGIVAVFYILFLCAAAEKPEEKGNGILFVSLLRIVCSLLVGAVFYLVSLSFFLKINDAALSSYNGINEITLPGLIDGLPENIGKTYKFFGVYYLTDTLKLNRLQYFGGFYLLLAVLAALLFFMAVRIWKANRIRLIVFIPAALAIPVACDAYMLLAGDNLVLQMTAGLALLVPLTMIIAFSCIQKQKVLRVACILLCTALLYGNSMQVWFDQEAMYEGRNSCQTMATQVITDLKNRDLLSDNYEYYFIGVPARNDYFAASEIYACANGYAQMGNFWVSGSCGQLSYHGLINNLMGFDLPMSDRYYEDLPKDYDISEIPVFPNDGYITVFDDHLVVIKISEYEKYREYSLY